MSETMDLMMSVVVGGLGFRDCSEMLICSERYCIIVCPKMDILYLRTTLELHNKNTEVTKMECPHLSTTPNGEICRLMVEQKLDGELDDFDIIHYCKGNQNHCYFYRSCRVRKPAAEQLEESKPERIKVASFDELFMLKPKEAEISINNDETHPLLSKLIERGFCHKLRPEFVERLIMRLRRK